MFTSSKLSDIRLAFLLIQLTQSFKKLELRKESENVAGIYWTKEILSTV